MGTAGGKRRHIGDPFAVPGVKPEKAQNPQDVLFDARTRITDETHQTGLKIGKPATGIIEGAITITEQGVDGKIPTPGVLQPIVGKSHLCLATIGFDVTTQ